MSDSGLTVLVEVLDEVFLALELPGELLRVDVPEGSLLRLGGRIGVHLKFCLIIIQDIRQFSLVIPVIEQNCGIIRNQLSN